ncbi:MAG TPA: PilZ domain-containing protein [Blastocatellia bacterium]|nr:PilZ domain-containing protein [Blastocatellia bacterium]
MAERIKTTNDQPAQTNTDQRKTPRLKMAIPIQITGYDAKHSKWQEVSRVLDVSRVGASFNLKRDVTPGLILYLSFPMPWKLRQYAHSDPSYKIYAITRSSLPQSNQQYRVGVEFFGQTPPQTYVEKPWTIFSTSDWKGQDRRRAVRKNLKEPIWVEYYKGFDDLIALEQGCTENVSKTGARICVQEPPLDFDLVKVFTIGQGFESMARITNQFVGQDGLHRLCVHFTEKQMEIGS